MPNTINPITTIVTILLWAISAALLVIGLLAVIFPQKSSEQFGIKATSKESLAFVRAMGAGDISFGGMGAFFILNFSLERSAWFVLMVALFSGVDGMISYLAGSKRWAFHAVSSAGLLMFSIFLWRFLADFLN